MYFICIDVCIWRGCRFRAAGRSWHIGLVFGRFQMLIHQQQLQRGSTTIWNSDLQLNCLLNISIKGTSETNMIIYVLQVRPSLRLATFGAKISFLLISEKPHLLRWAKRPFWWEDSIWVHRALPVIAKTWWNEPRNDAPSFSSHALRESNGI